MAQIQREDFMLSGRYDSVALDSLGSAFNIYNDKDLLGTLNLNLNFSLMFGPSLYKVLKHQKQKIVKSWA